MEKSIKVKCIKSVVMNHDNSIAFLLGKLYDAVSVESGDIKAKNEQGNYEHWIHSDGFGDEGWFDEHFIIVDLEENYAINLLKEEKSSLEEYIKVARERIESKKQQILEDEKRIAKAEKELSDINTVLDGKKFL